MNVKTVATALCATVVLATTSAASFANTTGNESNNPAVIQRLVSGTSGGSAANFALPSPSRSKMPVRKHWAAREGDQRSRTYDYR
jgi:hypothetical protein